MFSKVWATCGNGLQLEQYMDVQVKEHASKAQPRVKQAKILRDPERIEPADGLPRSRGLGFVEFTEHEHAICALRHLNNNPAPFSKHSYPPAWASSPAITQLRGMELQRLKILEHVCHVPAACV